MGESTRLGLAHVFILRAGALPFTLASPAPESLSRCDHARDHSRDALLSYAQCLRRSSGPSLRRRPLWALGQRYTEASRRRFIRSE